MFLCILYTYINRYAGTSNQRHAINLDMTQVYIIYSIEFGSTGKK